MKPEIGCNPQAEKKRILAALQYGLTALFMMALLLWIGVPVVSAAERDQTRTAPILSASEINYPPFCIVDAEGRPDGFSVELMRAALAAMGRDVVFRTGPWAEVREWLETGEVLALPLVGRTPEREALFDFTFPYMSLYGAIVVRRDTTGIQDLSDLIGCRVAVMKGDNAEEFLRRKDRGIEIFATSTFEQAFQELSIGSCDAVVIQRLVALRLIQETGLTNLQVISKPIEDFRQNFCFAVKKGDAKTLALLNEGLAIVIADGTFRHLHAKWFAALELPANRRIIIGGDHNFHPFEYLDENGRPAGYNVDLTRAIASVMDIDIEIRLGQWSDIVKNLEDGEIDVLQGMFYLPVRDLKFDFSQPHSKHHYVAVVRKGGDSPPLTLEALGDKNLVLQRGDAMHDLLVENGLGSRITLFESQEKVLKALAEGNHDCAVVTRISAFDLIRTNGWTNLVMGRHPLHTMDYCYSTLNGRMALLATFSEGLTILNKTGEYRQIYDKWLGVYEDAPPDPIQIIRYVSMAAVPLLLILIAAFTWSWALRRQVARQTEQLQRSAEQYRLLADNTIDAIWTMNMDLVFTYINPACYAMTGYTPEEWIGSRLQDHCDEENLAIMAEKVMEGIQGGTEFPGVVFEVVMLKKNREPFPVEIHGKIIFDDQDNPIMIQGVTRDISERRQAGVVRDKLQSQLLQAQKMESIGRLAGGVAHDYNNMLSVILGYSEMALEQVNPADPMHADLVEIQRAGKRSMEITQQLLGFARKQTIAPKVLDLNETVEEMLKMLRRLIGEDIHLEWHPEARLWKVKMDPAQTNQILANLCVNARDAIAGVGKITIETANITFDDDYCADHAGCIPGDFAMLAVSDDGCGMDTETLANMFEPFFTTKEVGKGTGLGLATIYGIVKQNNGFINVYSEPKKGTTFKIYLPRNADDAGASAVVERIVEITPGRGETVLMVEDEPKIIKMSKMMLEKLGYHVLTAETPGNAMRLASEHAGKIHLLMTDVIMPEMNGRDLAEKLKALYPDLKILYMSGYTANVIAHHGVLDGGVHFIEKPFSMRDLATKIRKAIDD